MLPKCLSILFLSACFWNYLDLAIDAQIIPDQSLGNESSVVTPNVNLKNAIADYIEGGAVRGNNLFHSFSEFNVLEQGRVYFASPSSIENILTRVTGNNLSDISGTLGVNGSANLFLLNPQGIIFGQNSQLDITGSFLATTADSYVFKNGFSYSASNPDAPPLLTVNIPVGLQFGSGMGQIINRSRKLPETNLSESTDGSLPIPEGLRVASGQTLSLIGGEVILEGGYINTSQGKIELGGIGAENTVKLIPQGNSWQTNYADVNTFADLKINQQGGIDGGQTGGSQITLTGNNISLGYDLKTLRELGYEAEDFFDLESQLSLDKLLRDQSRITAHNTNNFRPAQIDIEPIWYLYKRV